METPVYAFLQPQQSFMIQIKRKKNDKALSISQRSMKASFPTWNNPKEFSLHPWAELHLEIEGGVAYSPAENIQLYGIFENTPLTQITETAK